MGSELEKVKELLVESVSRSAQETKWLHIGLRSKSKHVRAAKLRAMGELLAIVERLECERDESVARLQATLEPPHSKSVERRLAVQKEEKE